MLNRLYHKTSRQQGFTLLEILIAVLVLAIGLLGIAGMQMLGLKNNNSAAMRSEGVFLAQDIADRMRTNVSNVASYVTTSTPSCSGLCSISTGCTGTELAQFDICAWRNAVAVLPNGVGYIEPVGVSADNIYRIRIMWDDERTGATGTGSGVTPCADVEMTCFDTEFRP